MKNYESIYKNESENYQLTSKNRFKQKKVENYTLKNY